MVEVGNPDYDLRLRYLQWLFRKTPLTREELAKTAEVAENVSMSHIKEIFVLAAKSAVKQKRGATVADLALATERVMEMFDGVSRHGHRSAGFGA